MAAIGADDELAVAFDDPVPGVAFGILRLLHRRGGRRSCLHGRCAGRNGSGALTANKTDTSGEAQGG